jgi:zinc-finger of transposase IS204/IS1001/IS1096/IS1165
MARVAFRTLTPAGLVADSVSTEAGRMLVAAHSNARCPACPVSDQMSGEVHSRYERHLLDLPALGRSVHLRLQAHRFRCGNAPCRPGRHPSTSSASTTSPASGASATARFCATWSGGGSSIGWRTGAGSAGRCAHGGVAGEHRQGRACPPDRRAAAADPLSRRGRHARAGSRTARPPAGRGPQEQPIDSGGALRCDQ